MKYPTKIRFFRDVQGRLLLLVIFLLSSWCCVGQQPSNIFDQTSSSAAQAAAQGGGSSSNSSSSSSETANVLKDDDEYEIIPVRYGYFAEARPIHAACGRGYFDLRLPNPNATAPKKGLLYRVTCYPQTSGGYALNKLDNSQLHIANLGSTPMAQGIAREIPITAIYISHYMGESQGIYVRPSSSSSTSSSGGSGGSSSLISVDASDSTSSSSTSYNGIQTPFDLVNKTLGVPFGSTMHYQVMFLIDLFGLTGSVTLLDLSPQEIIEAWSNQQIDAAACWGMARDYVLDAANNPTGSGGARTLLTARDLANWGRPTFVVVAASQQFALQNEQFMIHFVSILQQLNDSFLDRLGSIDYKNRQRWEAIPTSTTTSFQQPLSFDENLVDGNRTNTTITTRTRQRRTTAIAKSSTTTSYLPSLVDALMLFEERFQHPSQTEINKQREVLELFRQISGPVQNSCKYLGGSGSCPPNQMLPLVTLQHTADFLVQQKVIASLGPLEDLAEVAKLGYMNGTYLQLAQVCVIKPCLCQQTTNDDGGPCIPKTHPLGQYYNGSTSTMANKDNLLSSLEEMDNKVGRSPFATEEVGRKLGDSNCWWKKSIQDPMDLTGYFGDGANAEPGQSYSDNTSCKWIIRNKGCSTSIRTNSPLELDYCQGLVSVSFEKFRLWSGDFIRIYSDPTLLSCDPESISSLVLEAQLSGLYDGVRLRNATDGNIETRIDLPTFEARGCLLVTFETDSNSEKWYGGGGKTDQQQGDGFLAFYNRDAEGCLEYDDDDCTTPQDNTAFCMGTKKIDLKHRSVTSEIASSRAIGSKGIGLSNTPSHLHYRNDLDCTWDIQLPQTTNGLKVTIDQDLEPTHDLLYLQSGAESLGTKTSIYAVSTGKKLGIEYYIPTDFHKASLRLTTDGRGRRGGFVARIKPVSLDGSSNGRCANPGYSGTECEIQECRTSNQFQELSQRNDYTVAERYVLGRVVSQRFGRPVPANPWAPSGGCVWPIPLAKTTGSSIVGVRFVFLEPLDLEPKYNSSRGDELILETRDATESFYVEKCQSNEECFHTWQTGECKNGGCTVRQAVEAKVKLTADSNISLVTDRNDNGRTYLGLDFNAFLVTRCPSEAGLEHCEHPDLKGVCQFGLCTCPDGIPCDCPCDGEPPKRESANLGLILGIVIPVFLLMIGGFLVYRHRKIQASREQKRIIAEKEAELEAFQNSIVGMCVAIREYVPKALGESIKASVQGGGSSHTPGLKISYTREPPKVVWCWQETDTAMSNHDPSTVFGDPKDCWIKYNAECTDILEKAHQTGSSTQCSPLPGYVVDFNTMVQRKVQTGFEREVQRVVVGQSEQASDLDLTDAHFGEGLPRDLTGEPQMVLLKDDLVQISKKRDDGWVFGTKMSHADEAAARELVKMTVRDTTSADDAQILTDTGWFREEATAVPTKEQLKALQVKVGSVNALEAPESWTPVKDPGVVERIKLPLESSEAVDVITAFKSTLKPPKFKKVAVTRIERIQNLAMWQSYVVKRQTICYREAEINHTTPSDDAAQKRAQQRAERCWLWHGTNVEVMDKILQQGFNRSFCGKNATMYGKGVYFARDASYSAYPLYAVPDRRGHQYIMACRVVVGEYCKGVKDALTPKIRDSKTNVLYDTTVNDDTNPSIYVTYHDSQAYPERGSPQIEKFLSFSKKLWPSLRVHTTMELVSTQETG